MAAAQVTIPKQAKKRERTRVGKPDDVDRDRHRRGAEAAVTGWRRIGIAAIVLVLLAMAGTLAAIMHGDIKLPISAAVESAPHSGSRACPAPARRRARRVATPSGSPATDPIAGWSHFRDAFGATGAERSPGRTGTIRSPEPIAQSTAA